MSAVRPKVLFMMIRVQHKVSTSVGPLSFFPRRSQCCERRRLFAALARGEAQLYYFATCCCVKLFAIAGAGGSPSEHRTKSPYCCCCGWPPSLVLFLQQQPPPNCCCCPSPSSNNDNNSPVIVVLLCPPSSNNNTLPPIVVPSLSSKQQHHPLPPTPCFVVGSVHTPLLFPTRPSPIVVLPPPRPLTPPLPVDVVFQRLRLGRRSFKDDVVMAELTNLLHSEAPPVAQEAVTALGQAPTHARR